MSGYHKDFAGWIKRKQSLDLCERGPHVKEREIWWTSVGVNVGQETDGKHELYERPVLVLKKLTNTMFIVIPVTSKDKAGSYFVNISYKNRAGNVSLMDVRSFSNKRILRRLAILEEAQFRTVTEAFMRLFA